MPTAGSCARRRPWPRRNGASQIITVNLLAAQRPAEIVNYKSMGAMPAVLAGGLAAGAVAALGFTLNASIRRRRRDFALLKTHRVHPAAACRRRRPGRRP